MHYWSWATAATRRSSQACELVKIDPFAGFRDVLRRMADHSESAAPERLKSLATLGNHAQVNSL